MLGLGGDETADGGSSTQTAADNANAVAAGAAMMNSAGAMSAGKLAKIQEAADLINRVNAITSSGKAPAKLVEPAANVSGQYLLAFKKDGTLTPWAGRAIEAAGAAVASSMAADKAGDALASAAPFLSLFTGTAKDMTKDAAQSQATLAALGGIQNVRAGSDRSFASASDLSVYLHTKYASHKDYPKALAATLALYPDVKAVYESANKAARGL